MYLYSLKMENPLSLTLIIILSIVNDGSWFGVNNLRKFIIFTHSHTNKIHIHILM